MLGELPGDLEGQRAHAAARELGEEPPEDLGERQIRGDRPGRLRREQRRIDRVAGAPPVEDVEHLGRDLLRDEDLGLGRRGAEMRRQQRVRGVEERRAGRWFRVEDVDPGAGEVAGDERLRDRRLVDDPAARDVEHDRTRLHPGDRLAPDEPLGRAGQRHVHGHDVGAREQRLEVHQLDPVVGGLLGGHVRVDADDDHLHGPGAVRDGLADLAEPDDPERPAAQLETGELAALPLAAAERRVGGGRPARDAVEQGERVLGGGDRVAGRGVDDRDPGSRRGVEVDVVDADPGPPDDDEPRAGGDQLGIDLDLAADDERVVVGDQRGELLARAADPLVDLVMRGEELDALAGDGFGDEDPHAPAPAPAGRDDPERLERGALGGGDRGARRDRPAVRERDDLERAERPEDLLERDRAEVAEPEDLAGQLALAAGEDDAAPLDARC